VCRAGSGPPGPSPPGPSPPGPPPPPPSHSADRYWDFIGQLRADLGTNKLTLKGSGALNFMAPGRFGPSSPYNPSYSACSLPDSCPWSDEQLKDIMDWNGLYYLVAKTPMSTKPSPCNPNLKLAAHGSAFLSELSSTSEALLKATIARVKAADPSKKVLIYMHAFISSETGAESKYADSKVTDASGKQVYYSSCSGKMIYPLFYATPSNSYGKVLDQVVDKIFSMGADGIYHDEWGYAKVMYTYDHFDGHSVQLAANGAVAKEMAALPLAHLSHEVAMLKKIQGKGGVLIANRSPLTKTISDMRATEVHFREDIINSVAMQTHLYTPIGLARDPAQQTGIDPDPATKSMGGAASANAAGHLHLGTALFDYNIMFGAPSSAHGANSTVQAEMFPITPTTMAPGLISGPERTVTSNSGTYTFNSGDKLCAKTFDASGFQISAKASTTSATLTLGAGQLGVVVRGAAFCDSSQ
jgi:hypothetical protein